MTRHYHTLDGLRGVAALSVVAAHAGGWIVPMEFPHAYLAVDLFFALSGLVIAHAYHERLDAGLGVGQFMLLRLVRLYPLYMAGVAVGMLYFVVTTRFGVRLGIPPSQVLLAMGAALMMLPSPVGLDRLHWLAPFNIAAWSLIFEVGANLVLVLVWRRLDRGALLLIVVVSGALLATEVMVRGNADMGGNVGTALMAIARTTFSFFVGIALHRLPRCKPRTTRWAWVIPLSIVPLTMVGPGMGGLFDLLCIAIVFPLIIHLGASVEPPSSLGFKQLGVISYAIYALHSPLLPVANNILKLAGTTPRVQAPLGGLLLVTVMAVIAWIADLVYDGPVRRRLGTLLRSPGSAKPSVS